MRKLLVFSLFSLSSCLFTEDFSRFIEENYGENFLHLLQRKDLGEQGSFGGKINADEVLHNEPVIFVHGVSDTAGEKMKTVSNIFMENGYTRSELYATTYSDGSRGNPLSLTEYSMKCEYVKQVRALILAVRYYTGMNVDVVAYSLGVPIARKAVLGGFCIDTDEELGNPLTKYIDAFVGVAGPNHGIAPKDINKKEHYEGNAVFSIYSQADELIGFRVCDKVTAKINGEDSHKSFKNLNHDDLLLHSLDAVMSMILNHTTTVPLQMTGTRKWPAERHSVLSSPVNSVVQVASNLLTSTGDTLIQTGSNLLKSPPGKTVVRTASTLLNSTRREADIFKAFEAIFTDTRQSDLENIRKFFRQKFVDEDEANIAIEAKPSLASVFHRQPPSIRPDDYFGASNNNKKNSPNDDRIRVHDVQRHELKSESATVPLMRSKQKKDSEGFHTIISLKLPVGNK